MILPQIGPGPRDGRMLRAQSGRPELRDPAERLARLVPVAQFLRNHAEIVRDLQNQRIGVTKPPLPSRVGLLEHPTGGGRIVLLLHD